MVTLQPNLVMESRVQSSLNENCYHFITLANFMLTIHYPFPYERDVWHYKTLEMLWKQYVNFKRSDVLQILMLTRKCIHLTKLNENILTVLFLMKELFVIIGIHLGLIKILERKHINNKNPAYIFYCHSKNNSSAFQNFQFL